MTFFKGFVIFLFLTICAFDQVLCKPAAIETNEGRGIGTTIWDWVTYPFYWWSSDAEELPPSNAPLTAIGTTTLGPYDDVEVGKRNVTVWCNQHTCTTMRCSNDDCKNITCNIYDTYLNGECRVYNTLVKPENPTTPNILVINETSTASATESNSQTKDKNEQKVEDHPLELEAVMSSTVPESTGQKVPFNKEDSSSSKNKININ